MDYFDIMEYLGIIVTAFVAYRLLVYERKDKTKGHYTRPAWNFTLKRIYAEFEIKRQQAKDKKRILDDKSFYEIEAPKILPNDDSSDSQLICGHDDRGNSLLLKFTRLRHRVAEVWLVLRLASGDTFTLPDHPSTTIANGTPRIFEGAGLKLECIIPYAKWRVTFSGMLRCGVSQVVTDNETDLRFIRFNFIWVTASNPTIWPRDWSSKLIATSLATEKWRDGKWKNLMIKKDAGGYDQFGAIHGEMKIYENNPTAYVDGMTPKFDNLELHLPCIRQRRWGPNKNQHLHRTGVLIGNIEDGCAFEVGAMSGKFGLTHLQFGNVRFPNGRVVPIDWTDFTLAALGEYQNHLPEATTIQIEAGNKNFVVVVNFKNKMKIPLFGGSRKESWNAFLIPLEIKCNVKSGHGAAIFWYPKNLREFDIQEIPTTIKRIFNRIDKPSPKKLLLSFADWEAQSVQVAGGKGSSLAILRVIQETKGEDLLDHRNRSQQILNALVDQVSANPLKRSIRVKTLLEDRAAKPRQQRSGSLAKTVFPDPNDFNVPEFQVAQGFIISVSALDRHLHASENEIIMSALKELENVTHERVEGKLEDACGRVRTAFNLSRLDDELKQLIAQKLNQINFNGEARFAVRSSGVTEDSEESSAAGQNETFLGLKSNEEVFEAVIKCWASLFSFQSVKYRKLHIQPIVSSMAVVVQKMVDAEAAGVLFSRHPLNGDPSVAVITANFGLGESVVSGKAEPDTFYVRRSYKDEVEVLGVKAGEKKMMIEMDEHHVKEVVLDEQKKKQLCLSDEIVAQLAKLGVIMEKFFGTPRDIEFAITKDKRIFLLQSRPITSLNNLTDYEIIHENDSAVMSDQDLFSRANVGEVILGPVSVLTQSLITQCFEDLIYEDFNGKDVRNLALYPIYFPFFQQHFFMNVDKTYTANIKKKITITDRVGAMAVFGSDIYEEYPQLFEIAQHRNQYTSQSGFLQMKMLYRGLTQMGKFKASMDETCEKVRSQFDMKNIEKLTTSTDIWKFIQRGSIDMKSAALSHIVASNNSLVYQIFAFNILTQKDDKVNPRHQSDIAVILSSMSNVESANVPEMIQEIAGRIVLCDKREEFLQVDNHEAVEWIKQNCIEVSKLFEAFMKRHGHRSINELDFIAVPWSLTPEQVIAMIKSNLSIGVSTAGSTQKMMSSDEIIQNIKTPLGRVSKYLLKWLLPKCQRGVQNREEAKSKLVFVVNEIRRAVNHLGRTMVREGFLPDQSLVFHLSASEIRDLLATRDFKFVMKATRRQKLFAKLGEIKFPVLSFGTPRAFTMSDRPVPSGDVLVKGVPVCGGIYTGKACVCKSFADAGKLQKGDILITYGTDIGWSPYFPILGGICTEIGGLISHGAVVAREYGLPCIVSATFATEIIKDGQIITLDADHGTITALSIDM